MGVTSSPPAVGLCGVGFGGVPSDGASSIGSPGGGDSTSLIGGNVVGGVEFFPDFFCFFGAVVVVDSLVVVVVGRAVVVVVGRAVVVVVGA